MKRIVRRVRAYMDLDECAEFIGRDSPRAALRFLEAADEQMERLAGAPTIGSSFWETDDPRLTGLRFAPIRGFEKYLIFYRPIRNGIEIIRVLHGARNLRKLFGE
jgi:toxin ParE1/3/4